MKLFKRVTANVRNVILGSPSDADPPTNTETTTLPSPSLTIRQPAAPPKPQLHTVRGRPMPTDKQVKQSLFEGTGKFDAINIDDDDDFEETDPIQQKKTGGSVYSSYFAPTSKGDKTSARKVNDQSVSADEKRLLGVAEYDFSKIHSLLNLTRSRPTPADAVKVPIPTSRHPEDMASYKTNNKSPFTATKRLVASPYKPQDTLNRTSARSQFQQEKTKDRREPGATHSKQHVAVPNDVLPHTRVESGDGPPPRKKLRIDQPAPNNSYSSQLRTRAVNDGNHRLKRSLGSMYGMEAIDQEMEHSTTNGVRSTALRSIKNDTAPKAKAQRLIPDNLSSDGVAGDDFVRNAIHQRRKQEQKSPGQDSVQPQHNPTRAAENTHKLNHDIEAQDKPSTRLKASHVTPRASKIEQRLKGESPDALQEGFHSPSIDRKSRHVSLSPTEKARPLGQHFQLDTFVSCKFCKAKNCHLEIQEQTKSIDISYRDEEMMKDGLWPDIPVKKITDMIWPDEGECRVVMLKFSACDLLPGTTWYLEFNSLKEMTAFHSLVLRIDPTIKMSHRSSARLQAALTSAYVTTSQPVKNPLNTSTADTVTRSFSDGNSEAVRKRPRLVDHLDAPPRRASEHVKSESRERLRASASVSRSQDAEFRQSRNTLSSRQTRSGVVKRPEKEPTPPIQIDADPRRRDPAWVKPLVYPKTGKKETVTWDDLGRLEDGEFINDSLVGLFLRYLQVNANPEHLKRMHFFSTFFFETLVKKGKRQVNYEGVKNWTKNVNIFSRDFIVVPVCENLHWYVMILCNLKALVDLEDQPRSEKDEPETNPAIHEDKKEVVPTKNILESDVMTRDQLADDRSDFECEETDSKKRRAGRKPRVVVQRKYDVNGPIIITLDSLDMSRSLTAGLLKDYLVEEAKTKLHKDIDKSSIKGMSAKDIPHQGNWYDCGMYLCMYLEQFMANPHDFVKSLLRRESIIKWPQRLRSDALRDRLYYLMDELYKSQDAAEQAHLPLVGRILIRDEDFELPRERKRQSMLAGPEERRRMKESLDFVGNFYDERDARGGSTVDISHGVVRGAVTPEDLAAGTEILSTSRYFEQARQPIIVDDDTDTGIQKSAYATPRQSVQLPVRDLHIWRNGYSLGDDGNLRDFDASAVQKIRDYQAAPYPFKDDSGCEYLCNLIHHEQDFVKPENRHRRRNVQVERSPPHKTYTKTKETSSPQRPMSGLSTNTRHPDGDPAQLARRIREQRSPSIHDKAANGTMTRLAESDPAEEPRNLRGISVSTDFLTGTNSYDQLGDDEDVTNKDMTHRHTTHQDDDGSSFAGFDDEAASNGPHTTRDETQSSNRTIPESVYDDRGHRVGNQTREEPDLMLLDND
ncbi:hypothetical protein LTR05_002832 [Lithohypha guttulata]|uniref:Ubiquitin-like protease family profile domain-containing protein n=1 Tax=Lithohypha guttulata TaxID=1690604 RepID=A0AAN7T2W4_9EURO|nr:hypothetical protein LTR05_002832 [Lithohypha guttulata]